MNMLKIVCISDTHGKHDELDLPEADLLLIAGDISSTGTLNQLNDFNNWLGKQEHKFKEMITIAGNHDYSFDLNHNLGLIKNPNKKSGQEMLYNSTYLQDEEFVFDNVSIYGSPWQPEFYNWAFNLQRNGEELKEKWNNIPKNTDIVITHGPAWGILDDVDGRRGQHLGCELLRERIDEILPKIHICGHIHSGHGYYYNGHTHFFNASVLNERYEYAYDPFVFEWNPETNEIVWS